MIDSHIHLLPSIDDGAANTEVALEMLSVAAEDGINTIICTPHDLNGIYRNDRSKIMDCVDRLQHSCEDDELSIALYPGAELHMDPDLVAKVLQGDALTLADKGKHVLVEFPKIFSARHVEGILENLLFNQLTPIIAHPERNPVLTKDQHIFNEWLSWGCKAQLTAMSVTGEFGSAIQTVSQNWCQQGMVHLIASDAHRPTGRAPKLTRAYQQICEWLGEEAAVILFLENPRLIIEGNPLKNPPNKQQINPASGNKIKWYKRFFSM